MLTNAAMQPAARAGLRLALGIYFILLHVTLLIIVFKTNFLFLAGKTLGLVPSEEWNRSLVSRILAQAEQDQNIPPGQVILFGDSIIARLDTRLISSDAVNFGIGGDTTHTLYARLPVIRSLRRSRAVVIEVGVNDLKYRSIDQIIHDYGAVLNRLASSSVIIVMSVLPVDENGRAAWQRPYLRNERIEKFNKALKQLCEMHVRCRFLDAWPAMANGAIYSDDGWHLSREGSRSLARVIRNALPGPK